MDCIPVAPLIVLPGKGARSVPKCPRFWPCTCTDGGGGTTTDGGLIPAFDGGGGTTTDCLAPATLTDGGTTCDACCEGAARNRKEQTDPRTTTAPFCSDNGPCCASMLLTVTLFCCASLWTLHAPAA